MSEDRWEALLARAKAEGLAPGVVWKREALRGFLDALADDDPLRDRLVLQGGGALHYVYGSPRLSADLDFVLADVAAGIDAAAAIERLETSLGGVRLRAELARPSARMLRLTLRDDPAPGRRLAAKVEIYAIASLRPSRHGRLLVEEPVEIAADKVVACLDRLSRRRFVKTYDLYDLDRLIALDADLHPPAEMIAQKARSYGTRAGPDAWDALDVHLTLDSTVEDLEGSIVTVLPPAARDGFDARAALGCVRAALRRWRPR